MFSLKTNKNFNLIKLLAPVGCLQYFTSFAGTVRSFNWRDVAGNATRQLANQDYGICFRTVKKVTNLVNNKHI